jgi:hypothetical protein
MVGMNIFTILDLIGIVSGLIFIINYVRWMKLYSKKKRYTIIDLFKESTYRPYKVYPDKELTSEDTYTLNKIRIYMFIFFALAFSIAIISNFLISSRL